MTSDNLTRPIRRGAPRVPGGDPWPDAAEVPLRRVATGAAMQLATSTTAASLRSAEAVPPLSEGPAARRGSARFRCGLPRVAGGEPWPPRPDPVPVAELTADFADVSGMISETVPAEPASAPRTVGTAAVDKSPDDVHRTDAPVAADDTAPPGAARVLGPGASPARESRVLLGRTRAQRVRMVIVGLFGIVVAAVVVVLVARGLMTFAGVRDFVARHPGEYELPEGAPVGFPSWLSWQHFFNVFLMLLIIRSGIQVRREQRPKANWSPRWNSSRRISLTLWLHQGLDLLWGVNGLCFVVVLFATGQWMRVIPTSWEVFPNALTAALKYASLDWPTDNGWYAYNSLQQLVYFIVIFLAAPLAAATGARMSGLWPKKAERLSRAFPLELARALHFPVMLFFVGFIIVHVALVFATGALRNLNHMYGGSDHVSWLGFWIFVASLVVLAGGWLAARPLVVAPIASLFGRVGR